MPIDNNVPVEELLTALAGRDQSAVVAAMRGGSAKQLFQVIFDQGHGSAVAKLTPEKTLLEGEITGLKENVRVLTEQNKTLAEKAPDVARLQQEHKDAIAKLEQKHKDEKGALGATLVTERMGRAEFMLLSHLKEEGVDAEYAEVVVDKAKRSNRLRANDKGLVEAFRADVDTPFVSSDPKKDGLKLLAEELKGTVPAKFINVNGDSGGGTSSGAGGGAGDKKGTFKAIREEVKANEAKSATTDTAASRLSGAGARRSGTSG